MDKGVLEAVDNKPINFVVTANLEPEIVNLLQSLVPQLMEYDTLTFLLDDEADGEKTKNYVTQIKRFCAVYHRYTNPKFHFHKLNGDFAEHRNSVHHLDYLKDSFIIQLDADEEVEENFRKFHEIVFKSYPDIEKIDYPRENTVGGITPIHLKKWGWTIDDLGRINYPDYQGRGYLNNGKIHWVNKVHEVLVNHKNHICLDIAPLYHRKQIQKQESQNKLYEKIQ